MTWLKLGGAAAALLFVVFGIYCWIEERDARVKAESVQAAQQLVIDQAKKDSAGKDAEKAQVAADLQHRLDAIETQKQQPVSAPQFVVDLNKLIPNLPQQPVIVQVPAQTQTVNGKTETTPAQTVVQIPSADIQDLQAYKLSCDETGAKLDACGKQAELQIGQLKDAAIEMDALTKQRDAYKTALKGGSFMHRLAKGAKCLAITGGASAAGAWIDRKQPARGAVIGVVVGGVGCQVF